MHAILFLPRVHRCLRLSVCEYVDIHQIKACDYNDGGSLFNSLRHMSTIG